MSVPFDGQKAQIAAFYDRVAPDYDQVGPAVFTYFGRRMVELADVTPGARVLDLATGRGANLFLAAQRVGETGEVIGIDIAEGMVRETSETIARLKLRNASVQRMDAECLTFADASFDFVLCNFAIFWFPHREQTIKEVSRVLRPRGTFGVTLPGGNDRRWHWYYDLMNNYFQRYHFDLPPLGGGLPGNWETFEDLLAQTGFTRIRSIPVEGDMVYADEQEWWQAKWMHGERYPLENMPPDMLAGFKAEVIERMSPLKQSDGFHERWRVLCTLGRKPDR